MARMALVFIFSLSVVSAHGVTVKFPTEELATESVLPLFDNTEAVKSRIVTTAGRLELGLDLGWALNEPWFKTLRYGGHLGYHFNESHGLTVMGQVYEQGINQNARNIFASGGQAPIYINMENAPQSQYHVFLNYQVTPFYGKVSITKNSVMSLSLYGYAGLGVVGIGSVETEQAIAGNIGFGQKFYVSKSLGIRTDFGFVIYRGPFYVADDKLVDNPNVSSDDNPPEFRVSEFEKKTNFDFQLTISVILLL